MSIYSLYRYCDKQGLILVERGRRDGKDGWVFRRYDGTFVFFSDTQLVKALFSEGIY